MAPEVWGGTRCHCRFQGLTVGSQGPFKGSVLLGFLIAARRCCQLRQVSPPAPQTQCQLGMWVINTHLTDIPSVDHEGAMTSQFVREDPQEFPIYIHF